MRSRAEQLDGGSYALHTGRFAGMRHGEQSCRTRPGKRVNEKLRREASFVASESDADDVEIGQRRRQTRGSHCGVRAEVSREVDEELERRVRPGATQLAGDRRDRVAHVEPFVEERPHRRRNEQFAVYHVLSQGVLHELASQPGEVLGLLQSAIDGREREQKFLEILEAIRIARQVGLRESLVAKGVLPAGGPVAQGHAAIGREFDEGRASQAALEVAVEVHLGNPPGERRVLGHRATFRRPERRTAAAPGHRRGATPCVV